MNVSHRSIRHLLEGDLSGHSFKVISHSDPGLAGMKGIISKETKSMLFFTTSTGEVKQIPKIYGIFETELNGVPIRIDGKLLEGDPKRRKKRKLRSW